MTKSRFRWETAWRYPVVILLLVLNLIPIVGVLLTSIKTPSDIALNGLWSMPEAPTLDNFTSAFEDHETLLYIRNSLFVTILATAGSIALGVLAGYVFSKLRFRLRGPLFFIVVAGMFFPPQAVMIPLFKMYNSAGMYDTLWPVIVTHIAFGLPICALLATNFFATIPNAVREAAIIDGAGEFRILTRVLLPMMKPALGALVTLQFTWIWNDFIWPLLFVRSDSMRTVMVGIVSAQGQYNPAWGVQAAMALVATVPTLLVFAFFQRYFITGLAFGAVK